MARPVKPKPKPKTKASKSGTSASESRAQARAAPRKPRAPAAKSASAPDVGSILAELERLGTKRDREGMARYGIVAKKAFGVSVGTLRGIAKRIGRGEWSHELAEALWRSGWYEARLLAAFVDEPARVTPAQMDRWCRDFENWGDCDTVCFHLFDKTPHAFAKVAAWARRRPEMEKRAAFALLASLALHDRASGDEPFRDLLPLVEDGASDERNFVKKGVLWALRLVGERSPALRADALALARRLAGSESSSARWVGKSALRELSSAAAAKRSASRAKAKDKNVR